MHRFGPPCCPIQQLQVVCCRVRQQLYLHRLSPHSKASSHTGDLRSTEDLPPPPNNRGPLPTAASSPNRSAWARLRPKGRYGIEIGMAKNTKIVNLNGPPCNRGGCPTEIREHERVTKKELARPFYYSRWYNCPNQDCKTTHIMPPEFKVWNKNDAQGAHSLVRSPTEHGDSSKWQVRCISPSPPIKPNAVFVKNGFKASLCLECAQVDLIPANEDHKPCTVCGAEPSLT
jgi:hypothetical protein